MLKHHLLLIYRNLKKYKSSFFINLIGLSAGLTCALLIYLWVNDEMRMDKFHAKGTQLYQMMENENITGGINTSEGTSTILGEAMLAEMPEVEDAVAASPTLWLENSRLSVLAHQGVQAAGKFAGKDFFKVFSYPLVAGNINQVLQAKNSIVISEDLANKLFHTTDVLGKEIVWGGAEMEHENHAVISGVFKNIPANSSDHFDYLVSLELFYETAPQYLKWGNRGTHTFIVLKKDADPSQLAKKMRYFMKSKGEGYRQLFMRPYADGYLHGKYENGVQSGGRIEYVRLFSIVAIFILLIACINFMNLSTAKASRRMKEVGVKKVLGAQRGSLILQYMGESMLLAFLSLFVALLVTELLLPQFNMITGKLLAVHFDLNLVLTLLGITCFTGIVSGSYPALYLSGFNPATALKGKLIRSTGENWIRKGLVVFQFTLSVVLIVAVLVVYKQIEFVQTQNPGFQKDNVLYFETEGKLKDNVNPFLAEMKRLPGVVNASSINRNFLGDLNSTVGDFSWKGRNRREVIKFQHASVNNGLIETMGMKMLEGRTFNTEFGDESTKIIVNEAGIRAMRLKDPVGKIFNLWGKDLQIIGVVKDFHFESLHETVKPMFLRFEAEHTNRVMIRLKAGKEKEAITSIKDFYEKYNPGYSFDFKFLDQDFQAQYMAENKVASLSRYFAALAVIISCLGLFGLAAFTAERRLKEIGIRKVLGASEWSIVYILSKDFTIPVIVSILIAIPLSYVMTRYWLNTFAYRIELQAWYFVTAGVLALIISWITVGMQAVKAASVNPIQCLRDE